MLSIIIPTLNEEKFLPLLLKSIKEQDFLDYEIIVSDGNSIDKTEEIAKQYDCCFVNDNFHHHPSWQRNNGAVVAKGDILLFLDADTVLQPGFLKAVIEEFKCRSLTCAGFYFRFNPDKPSYKIFAFFYNSFCFFRQYFSPASIGAGIISKKEAHDKIGGFDPEIILAEDYDYCERISRLGKFRMIKSTILLYSSRRILRDGLFKTALAWANMARYTVFHKKIRNNKIKYEFGKY
jgi:glycosyltransferase involved in cell wall biosynthesis